jgi:hypothetical protein
MGFFSNLIAKLIGKSSSGANDIAHTIDPERMARVMSPAAVAKRDELLHQVFDGMVAAQPTGTFVPKSKQDPKGPLALHLTPAERMKIWLSKQKPEVVDAVSKSLNWDQAEEVILWVLMQEKTDAATAVKLFMLSQPAYYAIDGVTLDEGDFAKDVIDAFSSNWNAGKYARGNVGYDPSKPIYSNDDLIKIYGTTEVKDKSGKIIDFSAINDLKDIEELKRIETEKRSLGKLPWPPLNGLEGPFAGPEPKEPFEYFKGDREGLFTLRFLLAGLGSWSVGDEFDEADYKKWLFVNGFVDEVERL